MSFVLNTDHFSSLLLFILTYCLQFYFVFLACWDLRTCNISNMALNIPQSFINFPVRLESFTWRLLAPEYISTEVTSKSIFLQQDTQDKPCNSSTSGFTYEIISSTNKNQFRIGTFCPNGSYEEVQMRDNVTIIMHIPKQTDMRELLKHDLHVSFVSFIKGMSNYVQKESVKKCNVTMTTKTEKLLACMYCIKAW